ncbi:MAG: response regulator transcription factor [Bdellovibrionota bacterium]
MDTNARYTITLDDDASISRIIAQVTGIPSHGFATGESLMKKAGSMDPVAVFVDVHLEGNANGLDMIPELRKIYPFVPIIVQTSDPKDDLIGQALAIGANDFIRKPINPIELTGRLHARIQEMSARKKIDVMTIGDIEFSPSQSSVSKNGKVAYLPKLETQLLAILIEQRDLIASRDELKQRLWGRIAVSENTLDRKISDIRKALSEVGSLCVVQSHYRKGISLSYIAEEKKLG